jgi:hypothetical protein
MEPVELIARALPLDGYDPDTHEGRMEIYNDVRFTLKQLRAKADGRAPEWLGRATQDLDCAIDAERSALSHHIRDMRAGVS